MGVGIALDDFGTGYSSLSLLKRFPVDTLKIDSSFVHDMTTDPGDAAIVRAVIAMARTLRRNVVAEGVETSDQLRMLRAEGCAQGQGFLFGRPATADNLARRVRRTLQS
jgi:EAL domain-containing protein (putative c-di-GMP-specific phosphodiesterase class I)